MTLLKVEGLTKEFGGLVAVKDVSFEIQKGEIVGLIGPNGAGKTTLFRMLTGFHKPTRGKILINNTNVTGLRPDAVAKVGIVRTFQETALYSHLTTIDNIRVGCHLRCRANLWDCLVSSRIYREREKQSQISVEEIVELMRLKDYRDELAMNLPHGYQRRLGIAIALAANPKILLLDEPFCGMNPEEVNVLVEDIRRIHASGVTVLMVEHQMKAIMNLSHRVIVLNYGQKIAEGKPKEVVENKEVVEAYLGVSNECC